MKKNILITGLPKSGKSTLLKRVVADIPSKVGFVTNEIVGENGRVGFEVETHLGNKAVLAHIDFKTSHKVSKYFVNTQNLESLLPEVSNFGNKEILYLDEIGEMELFSEKFKELVLKFLDSKNTSILTLSDVYQDDFTKNIRKRNDIILVEISAQNREEKEKFIQQLLRKIEKARNYILEPTRFTVQGSLVELRSEHGIRRLVFIGGKWQCGCDFSKEYNICSHTIATEEFIKKK